METQEKSLSHEEKVKVLQNKVLKMKDGGSSSLSGRPLSHMMREKGTAEKAPLLNQILHLDEINQTITVEPDVTQEAWATYAIERGFVPPVVAEFKKITVGGGIMGASLESSSHRWGQMNDAALSYELLLGDGTVIHASPKENNELFWGVSGSYGAFARLLSITMPLLKAKPFVQITVETFSSIEEGVARMQTLFGKPDYLEGLVIHEKCFKVISGELSDTFLGDFYSLASASSPWYHQIVFEQSRPFTLSLKDYLFRYDRGAFWMGTYGLYPSLVSRFLLEGTLLMPPSLLKRLKDRPQGFYTEPKLPGSFFRQLFGWGMDSASLYRWLHWKRENWFEKNFIVQDFYLPASKTAEFIHFALKLTGIKPLWICPCKSAQTPQLFSPHTQGEPQLFDVGIYGFSSSGPEATRLLEQKTYALEGRKMFYSWNYLT